MQRAILALCCLSLIGCDEQAQLPTKPIESPVALQPPKKKPQTWNRFRGPNGNGILQQKWTVLEKPEKLWTASVGKGSASMIAHGDHLWTQGQMSGGSYLSCLNAKTGKEVWKAKTETWTRDSSPTYEDGKIYLLISHGRPEALCFDAKTGKKLWSQKLSKPTGQRHYGHTGSPVIWKDLVLLNVGLGAALEKSTGKVVWEKEGLGGLATPVVYEEAGQARVLIFAGDQLCSRDVRTGKEQWTIPWKTNLAVNAADPIYHNGKVFICTSYGLHAAAYDVSVSPPKRLWKEGGSSFSSGILQGTDLYFFSNNHLVCHDYVTGKRHWRGPHSGGGSVLLVGDKLILLNDRGSIQVAPVSTEKFDPVLRADVHTGTTWAPPTFIDGKLLIRNKDGEVVCTRIGKVTQ